MIRSRLRSPTSKSMTAVLCPRRARPLAKLALVVVLPTPPLPDVTTMLLAIRFPSGFQRLLHQPVAVEADLGRLAAQCVGQRVLTGAVDAGDGDQLGLQAQRQDAGLGVAARAG